MAYGKDIDEVLKSGDRSVEQVVDTSDRRVETEVADEAKAVEKDANPDVVDTSIDRPADGEVKVKETEGNTGVRAVVDHDEKAQAVVNKGADKVKHPIAGNNGETEGDRKAREAEEKRLKDLEVKSK